MGGAPQGPRRTGRPGAQGVARAREAAACTHLYQDLVDAGHDEHRIHLAMALHTHARALDLLDRPSEPLEPFDRSSVLRDLDVGGPVLGESLNNLADTLLDLGRDSGALPHALEAVARAGDDDDVRFVALTTLARAHGPWRPDDARAALTEAAAVTAGDPERAAILTQLGQDLGHDLDRN